MINAAGGDSTNLRDLLSGDPNLLKAINDIISANPSQQHTLKIVPGASVKPEVKAEAKVDNQLFGVQQSGSAETGMLATSIVFPVFSLSSIEVPFEVVVVLNTFLFQCHLGDRPWLPIEKHSRPTRIKV